MNLVVWEILCFVSGKIYASYKSSLFYNLIKRFLLVHIDCMIKYIMGLNGKNKIQLFLLVTDSDVLDNLFCRLLLVSVYINLLIHTGGVLEPFLFQRS